MAQIDTKVEGDAASCRRTADWLGKLASGVHDNGTAIRRARSSSESCWEGTAGDGFRDHIGTVATDADDLSGTTAQAQRALHGFADDLDTVNARMNQAREVAAHAGLTVTAAAIHGPGPAPVHRVGPITGQEAARFYQAQADHSAKVKAYREAKQTVDEARRLEQRAHAHLTGPMRHATSTSEKLVTISSTVTGQTIGITKGLHSQAKELYAKAEKLEQTSKRMEQMALNDDLTTAQRAAVAKLGTSTARGAKDARRVGKAFEKPIKRLPHGLRDKLAANPGQLLEDSEGILKVTSKLLKPLAGTAVCGTGGGIAGGLIGGLAGGKAAKQATDGH